MKKLLLLILLLFATASCVTAITMPTQQYNKIFLSPFYRVSMALNTNYTYNLSVNPPDGISKVNSAILSFNLQANGQTQAYTLWVNGQSCNNPTYSIATAFSTTGQLQFYFDCSNRITRTGNYTITLRSDTNTGAVSGWLDLTYMNNPKGDVLVSGTEYSPGDPATMFVQLKDAYGNAVQNGACYLDIWYPANGSSIHPYTIRDAPMIQALGDDGIYYYDTTAPSQLGVYMLSARCAYSYDWIWIYPPAELVYGPTRIAGAGTWNGATQNLNNPEDGVYDSCATSGSGTCSANYTYNITQYGNISNITSVNLYYLGESTAAKVMTFSYWNGTAMVALPNTLTFVATGATAAPSGLDSFQSNTIPSTAIINNTVKVQLSVTFTGSSTLWNNWLSLALLSSTGTIQDVKGSSEMHITNIANASAGQVWAYPTRNLTWYNMTDTTNYSLIQTVVWNATTRNLTYYPAQTDLTNYTLINQGVWAYINRTLTSAPENTTAIALAVWTSGTRNLTYYQNFTTPQVDMTNYSLIGIYVWNQTTRNLTYYQNFTVAQQDLTNYTLINSGVWNYVTRTLTSAPENLTAIANAIWTAGTRNLTYYQNFSVPQVDMTNYSRISNLTANDVWTYINRNLTYYAPSTVDTNAISQAVWNYTVRNLTYYQNFTVPQIDMTNYTLINQGVWAYSVRNLTYYPQTDMTNYTLISQGIWTYVARNLTYYPSQVDMTNYSQIAVNVWTYITRNLTYYPTVSNLTAGDIWNYAVRNLTFYEDKTNYTHITDTVPIAVWTYVTRNLTYYPNVTVTTQNVTVQNVTVIVQNVTVTTQNVTVQNVTVNTQTVSVNNYTIVVQNVSVNNSDIALAIWNATTRNLTYYPAQTDMTNYSLINQGVWAYNNRNLTYYPAQVDLTNYSQIEAGVWAYNNRTLTFYPIPTDLTNYTLINDGVWAYANRTLTYIPPAYVNNTAIATEVWSYSTRNLTYYQYNNITPEDVWNYMNRTLTYYELNNITVNDVWTYNNRTLTYYPAPVVNTTDIAENTWNYTARYVHGIIN